jgi:flagellar hook assembly protein FlgD
MLENLNPNTAIGVLATDSITPPAYANNPKSPLLPVTPIVGSTVEVVDGLLKTTGGLLVKPNPFSSFATVDFILAKADNYTVTLFDNNGKMVRQLKQGWTEAGLHNSINIDGTSLPQGFYFVTVKSGLQTKTYKLLKR